MPTTTYEDATFGVREIGARTDSAGTAVDDLPLEQDAMINAVVTEGFLTAGAFEVVADSPASLDVIVGSGSAKADQYVVETDETGRHPYIVRLDDANVTITLDAADASNPRIDEIWLVVRDPGLSGDAGSLALPRLAYRKGDAAASPTAPGADSAWAASVLLASVAVGAGVTSVDDGDITDQRATANLNATLVDAVTESITSDPGQWEVDDYATDASPSLTASESDVLTVTLTIPADWNTFKVFAEGGLTAVMEAASDRVNTRVRIGSENGQVVVCQVGTDAAALTFWRIPTNAAHHRTGLSGSAIEIDLRAWYALGDVLLSTNAWLHARAVRTS